MGQVARRQRAAPTVGPTSTQERRPAARSGPSVHDVITATARAFGVAPDDIVKDVRGRGESSARHIAMWIAREGLGLPPTEVAQGFARHYNATIRGLERAEITIRLDEDVRRRAVAVCESVGLLETATDLRSIAPGGGEGLIGLWADYPAEFYEQLASASTVDIVYNTGHNFLRDHGNKLEHAMLENGCRVRIILTSPDSPLLGADKALCAFSDREALEAQIRVSLEWVDGMTERLRGRGLSVSQLQVKLHDAPPTNGILIVDGERALVTQYLPFTDARPTYEFERTPGGGILRHLDRSFGRLWSAADERIATLSSHG